MRLHRFSGPCPFGGRHRRPVGFALNESGGQQQPQSGRAEHEITR